MKIWNVISRVALTLFIASILTFSFSTSITSANENPKKPCTGHHKNDDGCESGGDPPPSGNLDPVHILAADAGTNALSVHWLAPVGAARYEVRYSTAPLGDFSKWGAWGEHSDAFTAAEPGTDEYFTVRGLLVDVVYHVGVRAIDADGNPSALTIMSFISAETRHTAQPNPDIWEVDTVLVVPESAGGPSVVFDDAGSPVVAWIQNDPQEVRYAYQDGDEWLFEVVRQGEQVSGLPNGWGGFGANFGLAHQPVGLPGESFPAVIFRERTARLKKKRGQNERGTYYGYRRGANDWVIEEIVRGDLRVIDGQGEAEESLEFFLDDDLGWTPTVSYTVTPEGGQALVLAERVGEDDWTKTPVFRCDSPIGFESTELRRGANGDLHVMMGISDDDGHWTLVAHRRRDSFGDWTWTYARTDRTEGVYVETFAVDAQDRYYLAGTRRWQDIGGQSQTDVVLLVDGALASIDDDDPCNRPKLGETPFNKYEIVDPPGPGTFANGESDGTLVGNFPNSGVYAVHLTGDGPNQNPDVHLFADRKNYGVAEARVFSRCDPNNGWIRDMVDRPRINSRTVAVSETAMAWSFNLGPRNGSLQSDRLLIAQRVGNACSLP